MFLAKLNLDSLLSNVISGLHIVVFTFKKSS